MSRLRRRMLLIGSAGWAMLAVACTPAAPPAKPTSPPPTAAPTLSPSPVAVASPMLPWPGSLDAAVTAVVDYLNASPNNRVTLAQLLDRWGPAGSTSQVSHSLAESDLTGDGQAELVLGLVDAGSSADPRGAAGRVVAIHLEGGRYRAVPIPAPSVSGPVGGPVVQRVVDVNRDGAAEVLLTAERCDANGCTLYPGVVTWAGDGYRLLTAADLSMPSGAASLEDRDGDGRLELIMTGPPDSTQRSRTEVYKLLGGRYELAESTQPPTTSRFVMVQDANAAFARKDLRTAERLYERAATDTTLTDERPQSDAGLRAFARFRLMLLNVLVGQDDDARAVLEQMQTFDAATPYPAVAQVFWHTYGQTGSPEAGCRQVSESAARQQALLEPFAGRAPEMTTDQLCVVP